MNKKNDFYRVSLPVRFCHAILAICFLITAFSGISFFFPSVNFLGFVLGTPQLGRLLHPFFGLSVFLLLSFMFANLARDNIPNKQDILWFKNIKTVITGQENPDLPIGKYNAGQKIYFWSIMLLICGLLVTGLIIWRRYFSVYFPIEFLRIMILLHAFFGISFMLLVLGHAYLGFWVKGSVHGMIVGYVSKAWARKNHSAWYKEKITPIIAQQVTQEMAKKASEK